MDPIDPIMEQATQRLMANDYLAAERLCMESLGLARKAGDYERYARILLPLQESRRQRRQIAADAGTFVLGEPKLPAEQVLDRHPVGCLMLLSPPYSQQDVQSLRQLARVKGLFIEVLAMDAEALRACFEREMEREGDAALVRIKNLPVEQEIDALEKVVQSIGDHEIAHQRLAAAARRAARQLTTEPQRHGEKTEEKEF